MGTKNDPGAYDCLAAAEDDEPIFILLARDPLAPLVVRQWASAAEGQGQPEAKVENARQVAADMDAWRRKNRAETEQ